MFRAVALMVRMRMLSFVLVSARSLRSGLRDLVSLLRAMVRCLFRAVRRVISLVQHLGFGGAGGCVWVRGSIVRITVDAAV